MKWMEWLRQVREWFGRRVDAGGGTSNGLECLTKDSQFSDSQLTLPGMALQREWTYGKLRQG